MRLHGSGRIIKGIRVLGRFTLQLALVSERARATVTEKAVVSNKLDIVARMTSFDAVYADGISICRVTRSTAVEIVHRKGRV